MKRLSPIGSAIAFVAGTTASPVLGQAAPALPPEIMALRYACAGGDRNAMISCYNLGLRYMQGNGVPQDLQRAREEFARACDGAIAEGCNGVGYLGTNARERASGFSRACGLGHQPACAPWGANTYELGLEGYNNLLTALIGLGAGRWTVNYAHQVRDRAIGDLNITVQYDPTRAESALYYIQKLRELDIRAEEPRPR